MQSDTFPILPAHAAIARSAETFSDMPVARNAVVALLAVNVVAVGVPFLVELANHVLDAGIFLPEALNLRHDGSLPEMLGYAQTLLLAGLLLRLGRAQDSAMLRCLALVFLFVAADDAFGYHEAAGEVLTDWLALPSVLGIDPYDIGQLVAWGAAAMVLAVPFAIGWLRGAMRLDGDALVFVALFAGLVFFGIGVDAAHSANDGTALGKLLSYVEDGGEMLVLALACCHALLMSAGAKGAGAR